MYHFCGVSEILASTERVRPRAQHSTIVRDSPKTLGHNRYKICTEHNIPFKTIQKDFKNKDEVLLWMIDNQITRRNLSSGNKIILAQRKAPILEKLAKAKQAAAGLTFGNGMPKKEEVAFIHLDKSYKEEKPQPQKIEYKKPKIIEPPKPVHVRDEVAKIAGVSNGTVAKFEQVQKKKPELVKAICDREISINEAYNKVKLEEKKETIKQAEKKIVEQADESTKPVIAERARENKQEAANKMNASIGNTVSTEICKNVSPIDTQKEIAKVAGVSHDTIAKVETIEHKAPADTERIVCYIHNALLCNVS